MKKNKKIESVIPLLKESYNEKIVANTIKVAYEELNKLISENPNESKEVKVHTLGDIYPCISLYRGLIDSGIDKDEAQKFLDVSWSTLALPKAKAMQMLCKLPKMYKKMPAIFHKVTLSTFGEKQGFKAKFYETEKTRCKFDMTKCLYYDVCKKYNVPELTVCFCHTDDVTDGNIHPKLVWNRSKTMGEGKDCCDFDLYIKDEK